MADFYDPDLYTKTAIYSNATAEWLLDIIDKHFQKSTRDQSDLILLDVGCGPGNTAKKLSARFPKARRIIGVDLDTAMIRYARETRESEKFQFFEKDLSAPWSEWPAELTELEGKVDAIFSNYALHWIDDQPEPVALNLAKLLRPGGVLTATLPYCGNLTKVCETSEQLEWVQSRIHVPSESEFVSRYLFAFRDAGFNTVKVNYRTNSCNFPVEEYRKNFVKMIIRLFRRYLQPSTKNPAETEEEIDATLGKLLIQSRVKNVFREPNSNIDVFEYKHFMWTFTMVKE